MSQAPESKRSVGHLSPFHLSLSTSETGEAGDQERSLLSATRAKQISPIQLAYIGDAVYELYVRLHYLLPPKRIQHYHNQVVGQVRAESQAQQLARLLPHLTEAELAIARRGRNAATGHPRRMSLEDYQQATSLEALFGYLFLTDPTRLEILWQYIQFEDGAES
jgi:ribonuclease-3 family protein